MRYKIISYKELKINHHIIVTQLQMERISYFGCFINYRLDIKSKAKRKWSFESSIEPNFISR